MGDEGGGGGGGEVSAPPGQGLHVRQGASLKDYNTAFRVFFLMLLPICLKFGRLRVLKEAKIAFAAELICYKNLIFDI